MRHSRPASERSFHQLRRASLATATALLNRCTPADRNRQPRSGSAVVESLEPRRLLSGQTIEVANALDENGGGQPYAGSLRAAIVAANASPGSTVAFDQLPAGTEITLNADLPPITAAGTVIDGTTGPGSRVQIDGAGYNVIDVQASGVTIEGLFVQNADAAITLDAGSSDATVINNYLGDVTNAGSGGNNYGVLITNGSHDDTIGGGDASDRNIVSGNNNTYGSVNILVNDPNDDGTTENVIEGNYIGLDTTGTVIAGVNSYGVDLDGVHGNTIEDNAVTGNGVGIYTTPASDGQADYGNTISGNLLGLDGSGDSSPSYTRATDMIEVTGGATAGSPGDVVSGNTIQPNSPGADVFGIDIRGCGNAVSSNTVEDCGVGVVVESNAQDNTISQNVMLENGLGISLGDGPGILPNSPSGGSTASGPNGDQPFPILTVANAGDGVNLTVNAALTSNVNTTYTIEFFANNPSVTDSSGYGEGQTYIGSATLNTGLNGQGSASFNISSSLYNGDDISATATNSSPYNAATNPCGGATSEFAADAATPGVNSNATATTLTLSAASVAAGAPLTLSADVLPASSGGPTPTGTVTFTVTSGGNSSTQTVPLGSDGTATLQFPSTDLPDSPGAYSITAGYSGDSTYAASTSASQTLTITQNQANFGPAASVTTMSATAQTLVVGQSEILTLAVAPAAGSVLTPTGTVGIYVNGTNTTGVYRDTLTLGAGGTVSVSWYAQAAGNVTLTGYYSGDANYAPSTSNVLPQTCLAASAATATLAKVSIPSAVIAGSHVNSHVQAAIVNGGATMIGEFTVTLYADTASAGLSAAPYLLQSVTRNLKLKAGRTAAIPFAVKSLPASVADGTYYLVVEITDPDGNTSIANSSQPFTVAAPFVSLSATAGVVTPANLNAGQGAALTVAITNNGNETAVGPLTITLSPSSDGITPLANTTLADMTRSARIRRGATMRLKLHFRASGALAAGRYFPFLAISLDGASSSAVGAIAFAVP